MKRPITVGQIGNQKRRAIAVLFMAGFSFLDVARVFRIPKHVVEDAFRRYSRRAR